MYQISAKQFIFIFFEYFKNILNTYFCNIPNTVYEYNLFNVFEYLFGIRFLASIRVHIPNTFKKYFTQV